MNTVKLFKNMRCESFGKSIGASVKEFQENMFGGWNEIDPIEFVKEEICFYATPDEDHDPSGNNTFRWALFLNYCLKQNPTCWEKYDEETDELSVSFAFNNNSVLIFDEEKENDVDDLTLEEVTLILG